MGMYQIRKNRKLTRPDPVLRVRRIIAAIIDRVIVTVQHTVESIPQRKQRVGDRTSPHEVVDEFLVLGPQEAVAELRDGAGDVGECQAGDSVHLPEEVEGLPGGVAVVSEDVVHDAGVSAVFFVVADNYVVFVEGFPAVGPGP